MQLWQLRPCCKLQTVVYHACDSIDPHTPSPSSRLKNKTKNKQTNKTKQKQNKK